MLPLVAAIEGIMTVKVSGNVYSFDRLKGAAPQAAYICGWDAFSLPARRRIVLLRMWAPTAWLPAAPRSCRIARWNCTGWCRPAPGEAEAEDVFSAEEHPDIFMYACRYVGIDDPRRWMPGDEEVGERAREEVEDVVGKYLRIYHRNAAHDSPTAPRTPTPSRCASTSCTGRACLIHRWFGRPRWPGSVQGVHSPSSEVRVQFQGGVRRAAFPRNQGSSSSEANNRTRIRWSEIRDVPFPYPDRDTATKVLAHIEESESASWRSSSGWSRGPEPPGCRVSRIDLASAPTC